MSRYYVNKFLYQVDGDPELLAAYKADPAALVAHWEDEYGRRLGTSNRVERTTWLSFADAERALSSIEFFKTRFPEYIIRSMRSLTYRAAPDAREILLMRAIAIEVVRFLERAGVPVPPRKPTPKRPDGADAAAAAEPAPLPNQP